MRRDFTYIDDLIEGIVRLMDVVPVAGQPVQGEGVTDSLHLSRPDALSTLRGANPLLDFVTAVEAAKSMPAKRNMLPRQQGDVVDTLPVSG